MTAKSFIILADTAILAACTSTNNPIVIESKLRAPAVSRVPMTDWYWTDKPGQRGFHCCSIVGGYRIKLLEEIMK